MRTANGTYVRCALELLSIFCLISFQLSPSHLNVLLHFSVLSCPVLSYRVLPCLLLSSSVLFGSVLPCALQSPILYSCVYNIELSSLLTLDLGPHSMLPQADLFSELRPVCLRAVCSRLETFFSERTVAGSMRGTRERYILEYKREVSHSTAQNRTE
jgi:hypothetical protein